MHTIEDLIQLALNEDIGPGDITTDNLVAPDTRGKGTLVAKQDLVIAGLQVAEKVFTLLDSQVEFEALYADGDWIPGGSTVVVSGMGAEAAPVVASGTFDDTVATPGPESESNADMASSVLEDTPPNNRKTTKNIKMG